MTTGLLHGDCLELMKDLPDNSVDLVLTDPPYNIARKNNFNTMGRSGIDFGDWDHDADILSWIGQAGRVLKPTGTIVVFSSWFEFGHIKEQFNKNDITEKDLFRWIKSNPMPRN